MGLRHTKRDENDATSLSLLKKGRAEAQRRNGAKLPEKNSCQFVASFSGLKFSFPSVFFPIRVSTIRGYFLRSRHSAS